MQNPSITMFTAINIWLLSFSLCVNADTSVGSSTAGAEISTYLHLYTDPDGMTHFRDEKFRFQSVNEANSPTSMTYHELAGAQGATLVRMTKGVVEDWHNAPRTQFAIVIQGEVELTAGDGEVRRLFPGNIALLDDTTGKGHKTAALGSKDHIALMIPVKTGHK